MLAALLALSCAAAAPRPPAPRAAFSFDRDVRSVLAERCWGCHGAGEQKSGLRLDSRAALLKGGASGPAIVPGRSAGSELIRRLTAPDPKISMPPGRPLDREQIARIRAWIDAGATWPYGKGAGAPAAAPAPHWAFVPPARPPVPAGRQRGWVRNPIDAFLLAAMERRGVSPSPAADRAVLLRRVTLDLTGLPPTPEEVAAFLADRSPDAYEKTVRRLLASPRYGERWAQHWLDVVRFAETNGFEGDADRPHAWRYRDYVVRALNEDRPYDRFLREQIAGDLLGPDDMELRAATGFLRAGPKHVVGGNQDAAESRQEWLTEAVSGVGAAVLGLTIQCARCHDHKFDPIPQADYYRLQAFFAATDSLDYRPDDPKAREAHAEAERAHRERLRPVQEAIAAIEKPYRERLRQAKLEALEPPYAAALALPADRRSPEQQRLAQDAQRMLNVAWDELVAALAPADRERRAALRREMHALNLHAPPPLPAAAGVGETLSPVPATRVLLRGDPHAPGGEVRAAFPAVLGGAPAAPDAPRRLELARWLTDPAHPLTARVLVNRLWQHHFGRGLVATANDFGRNGQRPTHPELLDWLAGELVRQGWSLKAMHALMVTSSVYRQASASDARKAKLDPENRLLWRMNRARLDAEALRDAVLHAAGTLNEQRGGPPVRVPLEPEVYDTIFTEGEPDNLWPVTPDPRQHLRRSLYLLRKRNVRLPLLAVFDQPDAMSPCAARGQSVHSLQALTLMNSDFLLRQSRALAGRLYREGAGDADRMLRRLHLLTLGRSPLPAETRAAERFLRDQQALVRSRLARGEAAALPDPVPPGVDRAAAAAWVDLCLAAFNRNDFVYVQ